MGVPAPAGVGASGRPGPGDQANGVLSGTFQAIGVSQPFAFRGSMNLALWASYNTTLTTVNGSLAATVGAGGTIAPGAAINGSNVPLGTTVGTIVGTAITLLLPTLTFHGRTNASSTLMTGIFNTSGLLGATVTGPGIQAGTTVAESVIPSIPPSFGYSGARGTIRLSLQPTAANSTQNEPSMFTFKLTPAAVVTGADIAAVFTGAAIVYSGTIQVERSFDGGATWLVCNVGGQGLMAQYSAGTPINNSFPEWEMQVLYRLNCTVYGSGTMNYRMSQTGPAAQSLGIGGQ